MAPPQFSPFNPWYKTRPGIIFLSIFGLTCLVFGLFAALVGYYAWQIREGNGAELLLDLQSDAFTLGFTPAENAKTSAVSGAEVAEVIREKNPVFGNSDAASTVIMFIDFECPFCQKDFATTRDLRDQFGPAVRFVFKHFPLSSIHPNATPAAIAAVCADEQQRFWEFHDRLFETKTLDEADLLNSAGAVGLDPERFAACRASSQSAALVNQDFEDGVRLGVRGTPTYFVNGEKIEGVYSADVWQSVLVRVLGKEGI